MRSEKWETIRDHTQWRKTLAIRFVDIWVIFYFYYFWPLSHSHFHSLTHSISLSSIYSSKSTHTHTHTHKQHHYCRFVIILVSFIFVLLLLLPYEHKQYHCRKQTNTHTHCYKPIHGHLFRTTVVVTPSPLIRSILFYFRYYTIFLAIVLLLGKFNAFFFYPSRPSIQHIHTHTHTHSFRFTLARRKKIVGQVQKQ